MLQVREKTDDCLQGLGKHGVDLVYKEAILFFRGRRDEGAVRSEEGRVVVGVGGDEGNGALTPIPNIGWLMKVILKSGKLDGLRFRVAEDVLNSILESLTCAEGGDGNTGGDGISDSSFLTPLRQTSA